MSIVGVIPARAGSKGLPGKNIKLLAGKPMIAHVVEAAVKAEKLDRVIVSTDGEDIAAVAREYGAEVIMRPESIAGDTAPIEASLRHVVRELQTNEGYETSITVLMQANVPIRMPGEIDAVVDKLQQTGYDSVVSVFRVNQRPEWIKKVENERLVPFMVCNDYRRQLLPSLFMLDGAVMAVRVPVLMATENLSGVHKYIGENAGYYEADRIFSMDVDSEEDFAIVEAVMSYLKSMGRI